MHRGNPVRDDNSAPVMAAEKGILTREEFDQVGALLAPKPVAERPPVRTDSGALLLRVIHCNGCGSRMYLSKARPGKGRNVYQCSSYQYGANCPAPSTIRAEWADDYASSEFLRLVGPVQITRTLEIPGYDPQPEIDATVAEMEEHDEQKGRRKSQAGMAAWQRRADALETRLAELESREKTEPRREVLSTGRTYADDWHAADTMTRRTMLVETGARLMVKRGTKGGWRRLDLRRVEFTITGDLDPAIEENTTVADELATEHNPKHTPMAGASAHRNLALSTLTTAA
ncbi:zinc ribbon domain-containing protein [Streptomyces melanogenes]|uniref:zinc ribbon domain-containing protein n=1 Tax=Streptomyces melanogenes TaxID=67326 RepID=UPI0037B6DD7C